MGEITADNITDEQIRELRRDIVADPKSSLMLADEICNVAAIALDDGKFSFRAINNARARCAEILNARAAKAVR